MPNRKLTHAILSIMTNADVAIQDDYKQAREEYLKHQRIYEQKKQAYHAMLARLHAVLDPELDAMYKHISTLERAYLDTTPPERVWRDAKAACKVPVTKHKFGRMMREDGYYRTTVLVGGKPQARWRKAE